MSEFWERPYSSWGDKATWNHYYLWKNPKATEHDSHNALGDELKSLIRNLKPDSKEAVKALSMQCDLKVSVFYVFL